MLDVGDEDTGLWLKVLSTGSRLLRWVASSDLHLFHDKIIEAKKLWPENSTLACWWQTIEDRVLLCVEEVAWTSTSTHLSLHFEGFMVHRDVPPVTSTRKFIRNLACYPLTTSPCRKICLDIHKMCSPAQTMLRQ